MAITYTEPTLCTYDGDLSKAWFVYFTVTDTETGASVQKQFRGGINYYKDAVNRRKRGEEMVRYWKKELKAGWSPFTAKIARPLAGMTFHQALDFGMSKKVLAKKSRQDFQGMVRFSQAAAAALGIANLPVKAVKRQHIKFLMDHIRNERAWSNNAYNKNLTYLAAVLSELVEWDMIEYNPAHKIKALPVAESNKYEEYTEAEKKAIAAYFLQHDPRFFSLLMFEYDGEMRPAEILKMKIQDIRLDENIVLIVPDQEERNSKTLNVRRVAITPAMRREILNLGLDQYPKHYYVFGSPYEPGQGLRGYGRPRIAHPEYWKPSPTPIKRDTATKYWKRTVMAPIAKGGLGINKHFYAGKHTGAFDKTAVGIDLEAIQNQAGHTDVEQTRTYARNAKKLTKSQERRAKIEKDKALREQLVNLAPAFVSSMN